jgi:hypothetical protein
MEEFHIVPVGKKNQAEEEGTFSNSYCSNAVSFTRRAKHQDETIRLD